MLVLVHRKCVLNRVEFHHACEDHRVLLDRLLCLQRLVDDLLYLLGSVEIATVEPDMLLLVLRYEVLEV